MGHVRHSTHLDIQPGQLCEVNGRILRYQETSRATGELVFHDPEADAPRTYDRNQVRDMIRTGAFALLDSLNPEVCSYDITLDDLNHDLTRKATERRLAYLHGWERNGDDRVVNAVLRPVISAVAAEINDPNPPGASTVAKWIADWRRHGRSTLAAVPRIRYRGYRKDRLPQRVKEVYQEAFYKEYLHESEPTVMDAHGAAIDALKAEFAAELACGELKLPHPSTGYRLVLKMDAYTRSYYREGKKVAEQKFDPVGAGWLTTRHNELWEIDHLTAGFIAVQNGQPVGHPSVTAIIDRHTRMMMGLHVSFYSPSYYVVFECMKHALLPKQVPQGLTNDWPAYGKPRKIVCDRGAEFVGQSFIEALRLMGIDWEECRSGKPQDKGIIERWFEHVEKKLCQRLPGATFANVYRRRGKDAPAEEVACIDLDQFRALLAEWVIDYYHPKKHEGLGVSPLSAWHTSVAKHGEPIPLAINLVDNALRLTEHRKPQKYGIEFEGVLYQSDELGQLRGRIGERQTVQIRIDPSDIGSIRVVDPQTLRSFEVPVREDMAHLANGVTLTQHQTARALIQANPDKFTLDTNEALAKAHQILRKHVPDNRSKVPERRKAARYKERAHHEPLPQSDARPITEVLVPASPPVTPPAPQPPEPAPEPVERQSAVPPSDPDDIDFEALARAKGVRSIRRGSENGEG